MQCACGVQLSADDTIPCDHPDCGVHAALKARQDMARAAYGPGVEIISKHSTQIGGVQVNFTVGRIK